MIYYEAASILKVYTESRLTHLKGTSVCVCVCVFVFSVNGCSRGKRFTFTHLTEHSMLQSCLYGVMAGCVLV